MTHARRWWVLGLMLGLVPGTAASQTSSCRPADAESALEVAWVTGIVTGTDAGSVRQRIAMKLPQVSASQISYVTDARVCNKILAPYYAVSSFQAPANGPGEVPSNRLHVVKVGTVYVACDPALRGGGFRLYATFDKQYRLLWGGLG